MLLYRVAPSQKAMIMRVPYAEINKLGAVRDAVEFGVNCKLLCHFHNINLYCLQKLPRIAIHDGDDLFHAERVFKQLDDVGLKRKIGNV